MNILNNTLRVKHEKAVFPSLPPHLNGLRILHISDLHANNNGKMHLDIWPAVSELSFDLAMITGDIVTRQADELHPYLPGLRSLCARVPVFYVDGNHEMFCYDEVCEILKAAGVSVLANEEADCHLRRFGSVKILGVRDYLHLKMKRFDGIDALFSRKKGQFKIVLSHQPQFFYKVRKYGPFLLLAGHTHGGQVRLPFFPTLYAPGQGVLPEYGDGWYKYEGCRMYISRGIGTTLFTLRTFNRPELAVITLQTDSAVL